MAEVPEAMAVLGTWRFTIDTEDYALGRACAVILCLIFAPPGFATTKYFRSGCANNGDGTTYDCAASGGAIGAYNTASATSNLIANDTAIICGTWRAMFDITVSGVTVDLACSANANPARIYGTDTDSGSGWTLSGGEYSKEFAATGGPLVAVNNGTLQIPGTIGSLSSGQWACSPNSGVSGRSNACGGTGPYTVYVKDDPTGGTYEFGARNHGIRIGNTASSSSVPTITIDGGSGTGQILYQGCVGSAAGCSNNYGLGVGAYYDSWDRVNWAGGTWTVRGVTFIGQAQQAVHTNGTDATTGSAPDNIVIQDSYFYNQGGEAIYIKAVGDGTNGTATISGNTIGSSTYDDSGWYAEGSVCSAFDGEGIDLGGGAVNLLTTRITGNTIQYVRGTGILLSGGGTTDVALNTIGPINYAQDNCSKSAISIQSQSTLPIRANDNNLNPVYGDGIHLGGSAANAPSQSVIGNCITVPTGYAGIHSNASYASKFTINHNRLHAGTYGIRWSSGTPATNVLRGNEFSGVTYPFYETPASSTGIDAQGNNMTAFTSFLVANTSYASIAALEAARTTFVGNTSNITAPAPCGYTKKPKRRR